MARRKDKERRMSLGSHLRELRTRLSWSAGFILAGSVVGWFLFDPVFKILQQPLLDVTERRGIEAIVNFGTVVSAFDLRIQISIFPLVGSTHTFISFVRNRSMRPCLRGSQP